MVAKETNHDHYHTVKKEFARQSKSMQAARTFNDQEMIDRICFPVLEMNSGIRVLDLGCGPGILTTALAPSVAEIVALDITRAMIERTRQRSIECGLYNVLLKVGEAENLPFKKAYFDVVVTRLTFHHFASPLRVLAEMVRVLRVGGRVIIADVVSSENAAESELHNALEVLRDPSHIRMLSFKELRGLVESSNLKITDVDEWVTEREFGEWIKITNAPERGKSLFTILKNLAETGVSGGINLRFTDSKIRFNHRWSMIIAEKMLI